MQTQVVSYLDAQHCLAIATAFIAIIGACASLISGANSKAESLTNRIHEAAKEFRRNRRTGHTGRCDKIESQLDHYGQRFQKVQSAQRWLFRTICVFTACLAVFISLALYGSFSHTHDVTVYPFARYLLVVIGLGVVAGTAFMFRAIYLHYTEVFESFHTLDIEMSDCGAAGAKESKDSKSERHQHAAAAHAGEPLRSEG